MSDEILNRVSQSKLITFNLEEYYPPGKRTLLDIKNWLYKGIILREKEFRKQLLEYDWSQYKDTYVAITCSTDAIVPGWAFMLVASKLQPYALQVVQGSLEDLETALFYKSLEDLDYGIFKDKSVIIKGCSNKPVPANAYIYLTQKLQGVAKSIMYGEACSSVPLYKKK